LCRDVKTARADFKTNLIGFHESDSSCDSLVNGVKTFEPMELLGVGKAILYENESGSYSRECVSSPETSNCLFT